MHVGGNHFAAHTCDLYFAVYFKQWHEIIDYYTYTCCTK